MAPACCQCSSCFSSANSDGSAAAVKTSAGVYIKVQAPKHQFRCKASAQTMEGLDAQDMLMADACTLLWQ
jgi:hypothetical protein